MTNTWPGWRNAGLIGEGSFGKVYRIEREEFGQVYEAALKVISIPASSADIRAAYAEGMDQESVTQYFRGFVEDIVAEFALMSELKGNSNVVSYEDHMVVEHQGEIGWDILIRMELLTALTEYEARYPLQEWDVIRLGIDLAHALELCRKRGILHRDIKPENIFVSKDGDFKLGDFGVARIAEKTISAMSRKGTYNYMAPEVYRGEEYGYAADMYSLGLVLYRFLNDNRTPFLPPCPQPIQYADRERALIERISGRPLPPPAHGSKMLQEIVLKACAYRPEERFSSGKELIAALTKLQPEDGMQEAGTQGDRTQENVTQTAGKRETDTRTAGVWEDRTQTAGVWGAGNQTAGTWETDTRTAGIWEDRTQTAGEWENGTHETGAAGERTSQADSNEENRLEKTVSVFDGSTPGHRQQPGDAGKNRDRKIGKMPGMKNWYKSSVVGAAILPVLYFLSEVTFQLGRSNGLDEAVSGLVDWLHQGSLSAGGSYHRFQLVGVIHGVLLTWVFMLLVAAGIHFWKKMWRETVGKRVGIGLAFVAVVVLLLFLKGSIRTIGATEWDCYNFVLGMASAFGLETWWHFRGGKKKEPAWIWRRVHAYLLIQTWMLLSFYIGMIKFITEIEATQLYGDGWKRFLSFREQIQKKMELVQNFVSFFYNSPFLWIMLASLIVARIVQHQCKKRNFL